MKNGLIMYMRMEAKDTNLVDTSIGHLTIKNKFIVCQIFLELSPSRVPNMKRSV